MFTATKLGDSVDKQKRRRTVTVRFTNGESTFEKDFQFSIEESVEKMKKKVREYLDEINAEPEEITGDIADYTPPEEPKKTKAELDKEAWDADWAKLSEIQPYIEAGVFTGAEPKIVALKNKVRDGFKPAYLEL